MESQMELKWSFSETYPTALSTPDPQDDVAWLRWVIIQTSVGKTSEVIIHCKRVKTVNTFAEVEFVHPVSAGGSVKYLPAV